MFEEVCNLGVNLPDNGVSDAETRRSDVRLYLLVSKVRLLVS